MIRGYSRVSSYGQAKYGQSLAEQEEQLRQAGAEVIYTDIYTGTKSDRPELQRMLSEVEAGDVVVICKLDRIARSVRQGAEIIEQLMDKGAVVDVLNLGRLSNEPTGKLIYNTLLSIAEFERDMILTRCQEGREQARKSRQDYREGRPPIYGREQKELALELLETHSYSQVERMTGISKSTMIRFKRAKGLLK